MIEYETVNSPFFDANKAHVEALEKQLPGMQVFSGFCNAYGYDVEATFLLNRNTWTIQLVKSQTTQRGFYIPKNSTDHFEIIINVSGLNNKVSFSLRRSFFTWLFPLAKVPPPFSLRINSTDKVYIEQLSVIAQLYEPRFLKQTTGEFTGKFRVELKDLKEFIDYLEKLFI